MKSTRSGYRRWRDVVAITLGAALLATGAAPALAVERVSETENGTQAALGSSAGRPSADGRFVFFHTQASNLWPNDTNITDEVLRKDLQTGELSLASATASGQITSSEDTRFGTPFPSSDGQLVAYWSMADLYPGDEARTLDLFVKDMNTGTLELINVDGDGDRVAVGSQFFSNLPLDLSDDGRYVAFTSESSEFSDSGDAGNDVFLRDRAIDETVLVSNYPNGGPSGEVGFGFAMSPDGTKFVWEAFETVGDATTRRVFFRDISESTAELLPIDSDPNHGLRGISNTGRVFFVRIDGTPAMYATGAGSEAALPTSSDVATWKPTPDGSFIIESVGDDINTVERIRRRAVDGSELSEYLLTEHGEVPNREIHVGFPDADGSTVSFLTGATNLDVAVQSSGTWHAYAVQLPDGTFYDDDDSVFQNAIEWLAAEGITEGCNPPANNLFCPNDPVTRGQMAAFLARAFGYSETGTGDYFKDTADSVFENAIDRLRVAGVTEGCNPPDNDEYCPDGFVTRGQMAAFLVRAFGFTQSGTGNYFTDTTNSVFKTAIDRLRVAGVTEGCNPPDNDNYCPDDRVTRGQMAAFLKRGFGE